MGHRSLSAPAGSSPSTFASCVLFISLLALTSVGCGRSRDQVQARHSTITVLYPVDERAVGPFWQYPSQFLVFLPLVVRNAKGELEGRLAESWEHSPDYRTWTIHLRKGVRWQDGIPVTAHDIKFTLDLMGHPAVLMMPPGACSVTVVDDSTLTINYHEQAVSPLDDYTVYYPKHLLEGLDPKKFYDWEFWTHPVGDGPYRYVHHLAKTMMEFEANPDYFRGKPKIERVVLKFGDAAHGKGALIEFLSGNVDAVPFIEETDLLKMPGGSRFRLYYYLEPGTVTGIVWNERQPLFRDPKIRRALTLAINRRELQQLINLPNKIPIFDVIFTREQFRRAVLPDPLPYDPQLAKELLDGAGWRIADGEALRHRDGKPFRFTALVTPEDKAAVFIQEQLRRVGIDMEISTLEVEAERHRVLSGDFEAAIFIGLHGSGTIGHVAVFGETNPIGYRNSKVAELLNRAAATMDPVEIDRIYRQLWSIFQVDLPTTFLYPAVYTTVASLRVRGLSSPYRAEPVWYMEDLWLENEN